MAITLGSNIASLRAQRFLDKSTDQVSKSSERLASGLRINRASDDAAGLAIATTLNTDARVFSQGIRNINDGISALSIAEGALRELSSLTIRQQELAEQAANGSYSAAQRRVMHLEASALTDEYNRIVGTTSFNGISLLSTSQTVSIQAGSGQNSTIQVALGSSSSRTAGTGGFNKGVSFATVNGYTPYVNAGDVNGDGILDLIIPDYSNGGATGNSISIFIGNGDGSFKSYVSYQTNGTGPKDSKLIDINGDGNQDIVVTNYSSASISVLMGNSNGTFKSPLSWLSGNSNPTAVDIVDVNGDGKYDIISQDWAGKINVGFGNGDGTFKARTSYFNAGGSVLRVSDFNEDGINDIISINQNNATFSVLNGNADGTFKLNVSYGITGATLSDINIGDFNQDGYSDFIANSYGGNTIYVGLGNGNGTFNISSLAAAGGPRGSEIVDVNSDGYQDIITTDNGVSTWLGNGDGTFKSQISTTTALTSPWYLKSGDFDRNGTVDFLMGDHAANNSIMIAFGDVQLTGTATHVSLLTQADARSAIDTLQAQLTRITNELGSLGSYQSRLNIAANVLGASRENYISAASRITDIDVADETSRLVSGQILQQVTTAILAQANQQPAIALKLLG